MLPKSPPQLRFQVAQMPPAHRRRFVSRCPIAVVLAVLTVVSCTLPGCSKASKSGLDALPRSRAAKRPQGPQTMGNLLLDSYIQDLGSGQLDTRLRAARELGNMGADAKKALPALEKMAGDKNAKASGAAKEAIAAIRRR